MLIIAAIVLMSVSFAVSGLMVGDSVFVLMVIGVIWVALRLRMEATYRAQEQERLTRSLVPVRTRDRR